MKRLLLPFFFTLPLFADPLLPPPCPKARQGAIEAQFDFLYLRVSTCDHTYAIEDGRPFSAVEVPNRLPSGKSIRVNPDGGLGFRASLGYMIEGCSKDLTLIYSTISNADKEEATPSEPAGGFWPTNPHPLYMQQTPIYSPDLTNENPALVTGDASFDWDAVELQLGQVSRTRCNTTVRFFASLYYVHLRNGFLTTYLGLEDPGALNPVTLSSSVDFNGKSWGVGPRLGFDLRTRIWCGLGVAGHFGVGLLGGRTESKQFERDIRQLSPMDVLSDESLNVFDEEKNILFPNISGALGVNYTYICENFFAFIAEIGYEYTAYINAVRSKPWYNDERGTRVQNCENFDTNGVYVRFKVRM